VRPRRILFSSPHFRSLSLSLWIAGSRLALSLSPKSRKDVGSRDETRSVL
jgi:hypothetical protein